METFPQDLLTGVFPLVFAVSTLATPTAEATSPTNNSPRRSLFDRFLDAVAASLVDGPDATNDASEPRRQSHSLFRPDDDFSSDDDDFELFSASSSKRKSNSNNISLSAGFYAGFGRRPASSQTNNKDSDRINTPSYAKALQQGQGFFQRARIESVSTQHGLPPCKDPDGTDNLPTAVAQFYKNRDLKLGKLLLETYPLTGILPAGWLEKHAHALPSVILVVCSVCASQREQNEADKRLLETVTYFAESMVSKRQCTIHVVGLMTDDVTVEQAEEWNRTIMGMMMDEETGSSDMFRVALVRSNTDLEASDNGLPTSPALRELHQSVRDASMQYYLGQARRTKDKIIKLTQDKQRQSQAGPPNALLPLIIRYCFKIAIFYEFQWKHEKSLRFMAEAYRHAAKYYEYLVYLRAHPESQQDMGGESAHSVSIAGDDELEVSLNQATNMNMEELWKQIVPPPPDDMIHQCRSVAEWLNLKLLQAGFASHTEGGLLAADQQWRKHCRLFCSRRYASRLSSTNSWFEGAFIARNWLVMSQLVERHPPKALGNLGNEYDEVLLRCSPWRTYEATVDATLQLWRAVEAKRQSGEHPETAENGDPMRARFIGGFGSEGLRTELVELYKVDLRAKALDLALRAISLYETECEKEKRGFYAEDVAKERSTSRAGVKLYYSVGGILFGLGRHQEAAVYLEKATRYALGWPGLQLAIRKMLIECFEKHVPSSSNSNDESNQAIVSMILDSYFNAKMSAQSLRRALDHFASMSGGGESLNWFHESENEEDRSLPFSFAVTFPGRTHATAGDNVKASVLITSNLDYAVHLNSAVLLSLAGELPIPSIDLLSAQNASEGSEGGIIIQSKTSIIISTEVELPKDTSLIAVDDSGNGGEIQGVAGKGSFAKSARPRSAGVTSAGGARLVSEEDKLPGRRVSQGWSLGFLGGKPLRCDGIKLIFYPVQVEKATGGDNVTLIQLILKKKKAKTPANIKRTPFEEENYIASAWSRPSHLPLSRGPRSLRVLGPMPEMTVKDLTEDLTGGRAVEGTVNRIIFKLTAGEKERCKDIKCRVSCFSVIVTPTGSTLRLVPDNESVPEGGGSISMKDPNVRAPCLVSLSSDAASASPDTIVGYSLPEKWNLAGSGHKFTEPPISSLANSDSKFIHLNLFRPAPAVQNDSLFQEDGHVISGESAVCKTDFYVNISYLKERPQKVPTKRLGMRAASRKRAKPVMSTTQLPDNDANQTTEGMRDSSEEPDLVVSETPKFDEVSFEYTGSVVWSQPLSATFKTSTRIYPSGGLHFSVGEKNNESDGQSDISIADGGSVTTKCWLKAFDDSAEIKTEIVGIHFDTTPRAGSLAVIIPQNTFLDQSNLLYAPETNDLYRFLTPGSSQSTAYTVKASIKENVLESRVQEPLGSIVITWKPSPLAIPNEAASCFADLLVPGHGPLRLPAPSKLRFFGPLCCIEKAPLEARVVPLISRPCANEPFQVSYTIRNNSYRHEAANVDVMYDFDEEDDFVFSGLTHGDIFLSPFETKTLTYTLLVGTAGKIKLPCMRISSARHKSWMVNGAERDIYIFPPRKSDETGLPPSLSF